jgi:hypothetical protein
MSENFTQKGPDLGSEIRKKYIPNSDPGGKKAPDPGSGTLGTGIGSSKIIRLSHQTLLERKRNYDTPTVPRTTIPRTTIPRTTLPRSDNP